MRRAVPLAYTELVPPDDLAPYVDRLWLRTTVRADPARRHRVLPDGCVDILVHADRATASVVGTMTRALVVPERPGAVIAVRFKPGTATAIARTGLAELTDRDAELGELGLAAAFCAQIADAASPARRIALLVAWLRARLAAAAPPDARIAHAVQRLARGVAVEDVGHELGLSRQHLARAFRREVGISPKAFARVARMQRAAAALPGAPSLARLAVELGYFDQAHLANELRALTGLSPTQLAAAPPTTLAHLYGDRVPFLQGGARAAL